MESKHDRNTQPKHQQQRIYHKKCNGQRCQQLEVVLVEKRNTVIFEQILQVLSFYSDLVAPRVHVHPPKSLVLGTVWILVSVAVCMMHPVGARPCQHRTGIGEQGHRLHIPSVPVAGLEALVTEVPVITSTDRCGRYPLPPKETGHKHPQLTHHERRYQHQVAEAMERQQFSRIVHIVSSITQINRFVNKIVITCYYYLFQNSPGVSSGLMEMHKDLFESHWHNKRSLQ